MKQEELRINSLYNSVKFNVPVELSAEDFYELVVRAEGASIEHYIDEMFEPIELTEEWLMDVGFKKNDSGSGLSIKCGEYTISVTMNGFSGTLKSSTKWFVSILTGHGSQPVTIIKEYVHQLQGLYSELSGKELK